MSSAIHPLYLIFIVIHYVIVPIRVASHLFTGGFAGIGKLPALFGWYIRYGIGIKVGLTNNANNIRSPYLMGI